MPTTPSPYWHTTRFQIDLSQPRVMGIVNVTPDSFSDGGQHFSPESAHRAALLHCEQLVRDGAELLDIGGESTRPGAPPLPLDEELARVLPVLRHALALGVPVSVDTYKPEVMRVALDLGVDIINDVWALRQSGALDVVASHGHCGVCLMHMHREPQTMQAVTMSGDVVPQVQLFLAQRAAALEQAGVQAACVVLDAGVGFGKTVGQNFALLAHPQALLSLGYPVMAAWSRKSSLGVVCGEGGVALAADQRMVASVAAAVLAAERGARILRVHDVRETVQALKVWRAAQPS